MKEIPILFSTAMVQAILNGNKTQTRRVVKFPLKSPTHMASINDSDNPPPVEWCPYGKPGDLLWVRETLHQDNEFGYRYAADKHYIAYVPSLYYYRSENYNGNIPAIHMPKWAARIWLRVKNVRVERLQDISEADAINEGIEKVSVGFKSYEVIHTGKYKGQAHPHAVVPNKNATQSFKELWQSINGRESWDSNPWVWVVEYEVLSTTGKPELTITRAEALAQGYELVHAPELDREFPNVSIDEIEDDEILRLKPKVCEKEPYKTNVEEGVAYYRNTILTLIP